MQTRNAIIRLTPRFAPRLALCLSLIVALEVNTEQQNADQAFTPDPEAGRQLAAPCAACHGQNGNSAVPSYPSIAGQNVRYLVRQMKMIRDGERPAGLMIGQLDNRTDEEIEHLAAFYASQTSKVGQADPDGIELGEAIYRGGLLDKQVAACTACHAPDGSGNPPAGFPSLSGQQPDYVLAQLQAYREGIRTTDEEYGGMMRQIAAKLTDSEMKAVANYILGLH